MTLQEKTGVKPGKDLTNGSIPRHLVSFALPMLLGNLIQTGYGFINTIWIGNLVGQNAVGVAAVSFPISFVFLSICIGATMATTILVSHLYGAGKERELKKVIGTSFSIALILGLMLTPVGILTSDILLNAMNTPIEQMALASGYLKITLAGFLLQYLGNLIAAILRGLGDSVKSLVFMGIGVGINALLDPILIGGFWLIPALGINGAAVASLIAEAVSAAVGIGVLTRNSRFSGLLPNWLCFDKSTAFLIFKIGLPSIVQHSFISIGSGIITGFVNSYGAFALDAFGAGCRVDNIAMLPATALDMAAAALTGQNLGARKPERVKGIFKWVNLLAVAITIPISLLVVLFPGPILTLFGFDAGNGEGMRIGIQYLRICGAGYAFFAVLFATNGIISGAGHTIPVMVFSLASLWVVRVPLAWVLSGTFLKVSGIWISINAGYFTAMLVSLWYYFSGRWRKETIQEKIGYETLES